MGLQKLLTEVEFQRFSKYGIFKLTYEDIIVYWGRRKEQALSLVLTYPYGKLVNGKLKIYSTDFLRKHGNRFLTEVVE